MPREKGKRLDGYYADYVVFDIETTGLSPYYDEIIELSAVKVQGGKMTDTFSTLVKPQRKIPRSATAINGITNEMVQNAPTLDKVMPDFLTFIADQILVGHNIHTFDMNFICDAALEHCRCQIGNAYVDTLYMARKCLPKLAHHRLGDVCEYFGIDTQGAHRALQDCMMNCQCYERMGELLEQDSYVTADHIAKADKAGSFYCRAVHAILNFRQDEQVCGNGCPCFIGTDEKGFPICRYENLEALETPARSPKSWYQRIEKALQDRKLPLFPKTTGTLQELWECYQFAAGAHQGQYRKGTTLPYFTHIITTLNYARMLTQDHEVLSAAILHDVVEDTAVTLEEIKERFGEKTASYIEAETEDKRPGIPAEQTWEIRKQENINHLLNACHEVKIIVLADKTANAESMLREWHKVGDTMWEKFNQKDKTKQAWYYRSCQQALQEFAQTSVMKYYNHYLDELFGK